jgi:hypothetical protein
MAKYTVVLTKMMSQVINVETDDGIKIAVAEAMDQESISPGANDGYDAAGETEVQCVDVDGVTVWERDSCDERLLFER